MRLALWLSACTITSSNLAMKKILPWMIITIILNASCQSVSRDDITRLQLDNYKLHQRIDSLSLKINLLLASQQSKTVGTKKKSSKKTSVIKEQVFLAPSSSSADQESRYSAPSSNSKRSTVTTEAYSNRCQATTKKGSQCKRNARSGGYCWQHGG